MKKEREEASEHGRALAALGASKGGKARAAALSREDRSEIAKLAAEKRWADLAGIPKETHTGVLKIGDKEIPCSVLDNGLRVLSGSGVSKVMGSRKKGANVPAKDGSESSPQLLPFLASSNVRPFIPDDLLAPLISPIRYRAVRGGRALGYEATLLPRICEAILDAHKAGVLRSTQRYLADTAELLMRGLARVGIIALVDEATGYQADRAKDELIKILEAYISKELLPWTRRFPREFFEEIYRLNDWRFIPGSLRGPRYVGKLINQLVYKKLPPGVLEELQRKNPVQEDAHRRHKHHQFLTEDVGNRHLDKQITAVMTLMRAAEDKTTFRRLFERVFRVKGQQLAIDFPQIDFPQAEENS